MTPNHSLARTALALLAGTGALAQSVRAQAGSYTIIDIGDLGPPGEPTGTNATGMNELGHVAAITADGYDYVPVLYRDGELVNLGALPGSVVSGGGKGVSNRDQVAGWAVAPYPGGGYQGEPFLWTEDEGMINPVDDEPVNYSGEAWDVNDAGQAVFTGRGGFIDPVAGLRFLTFPDGGAAWKSWDLNEDGVVSGSAFGPTGQVNAYRYDSRTDTIVNLNDPVIDNISDGYGINDRGDVVGWAIQFDGGLPAMLWTADGQTIRLPVGDLGPAHVDGTAEHINNHGDVVGLDSFPGPTGGDPDLAPIGWVAFGALDGSPIERLRLLDLLDPPMARLWSRLHPFEINDRGEICGLGVSHDGLARGFLMVPSAPDHFRSLAGSRAGVDGHPVLIGKGSPTPGTPVELSLVKAHPSARAYLVWSLSGVSPAPMGGLGAADLVGHPLTFGTFMTTADGSLDVVLEWPSRLGSNLRVEAHFLIADPSVPSGFSASNVITQAMP